ncbi:MAG: hypothetical protein K9H49_20490 [Bacteroidales bacterium]|nr:hypothetical protein [Bacteroidales bacterium]
MLRTLLNITMILLILTSCSSNGKKDRAIISGHIPEIASKTIWIEANDSTFDCAVDSFGIFRFDIPSARPGYLFIKELEKKVFYLPGESLLVEKVDKTYKYSGGQSALINNYYIAWNKHLYAVADTSDSEKYYNQKPYRIDIW